MAKKKKAKVKSHVNGTSFLTLDPKKVPVVALWGTGPEITYPKEFQLVNAMKVNQSAYFPREKLNIVNAIRSRLAKTTNKKFIIRKVDPVNNRIWRVADNTKIGTGGRIKGVSPYKKAKEKVTTEN